MSDIITADQIALAALNLVNSGVDARGRFNVAPGDAVDVVIATIERSRAAFAALQNGSGGSLSNIDEKISVMNAETDARVRADQKAEVEIVDALTNKFNARS